MPYARVKDIDFTGKKKCWSAIETCKISSHSRYSQSPAPTAQRASRSPTPIFKAPNASRTKAFLDSLATCSSKPAILSLVEPHSSRYVPKSVDGSPPVCLSTQYNAE